MMRRNILVPVYPCLQGLLLGSLLLAGCQSNNGTDETTAGAETPPAAISYPAYDNEAPSPSRTDTATRDTATEQEDAEEDSQLREAGRRAGELASQTGEGLTDAARRAAGLARNLVDSLRGDPDGEEADSEDAE